MGNFLAKKGKKGISKIILATNQKRFFIEKLMEKSKLLVQISTVSRKKIEATDQKVHNFQLTKIVKQRPARMKTIDFISIQSQ